MGTSMWDEHNRQVAELQARHDIEQEEIRRQEAIRNAPVAVIPVGKDPSTQVEENHIVHTFDGMPLETPAQNAEPDLFAMLKAFSPGGDFYSPNQVSTERAEMKIAQVSLPNGVPIATREPSKIPLILMLAAGAIALYFVTKKGKK